MTATVISGATSYKPEALRIFLLSAREYMPFARIILIRDSHDPDFLAAVQRYNPAVEVYVPWDSALRRLVWRVAENHREWCVKVGRLQARLHISGGRAFHALFLHIHLVRHIHAQLLLRKISSDYVLMADSRDVVFQANPFEGMGERLITGEEPVRIGSCPVNSGFVRTLYGEGILERLAALPILCAGVTYGPAGLMGKYVATMVEEIVRIAPRIYLDYGLDQGIHMKVLHLSPPAPVLASANGTRHLATLHYSKFNEFRFDPGAGMLTLAGEPVSIVHQYDRHPVSREWFEKRYSLGPDG